MMWTVIWFATLVIAYLIGEKAGRKVND